MRVNPEELVELTNHGSMKLQYAVARAMLLPPIERSKATIVRQNEPFVLKFKIIKDLSNAFERSRRAKPRKQRSTAKRSRSHRPSRPQGRKSSSRSRAA